MTVISAKTLDLEFSKEIDLVSRIVKSIEEGKLSSTIDNRIVTLSPLEFLFAYSSMSQTSGKISPYRKPFLDLFQSLESASPGSAYIAGQMLVNECDLGEVFFLGRAKSSNIFDALENLISREENQVVRGIIESGGGFKKSTFDNPFSIDHYVIKAKSKNDICISIEREFLTRKFFSIGQANIIFCDGVFEKMSEIDNIVHWSKKSSRPVILVARGFLPEVTSTLFYNFSNENLKIIPCSVQYSNDDPFNLDDLANMCGSRMIPGPLSIYDEEKLNSLSGEITSAYLKEGGFYVSPLNSKSLEISDRAADVSTERMTRILGGSIKVSLPKTCSLVERSRITKGVHLYRQYSRSDLLSFSKFKFPITMVSYKRILSSVETFLKASQSTKFYIKDKDGMEI